jgi:hypothetical protein
MLLRKWPNSGGVAIICERVAGQHVYARCTWGYLSVYERKRQGRAGTRSRSKMLSQNKFTFANISALASAPQFPNWG